MRLRQQVPITRDLKIDSFGAGGQKRHWLDWLHQVVLLKRGEGAAGPDEVDIILTFSPS